MYDKFYDPSHDERHVNISYEIDQMYDQLRALEYKRDSLHKDNPVRKELTEQLKDLRKQIKSKEKEADQIFKTIIEEQMVEFRKYVCDIKPEQCLNKVLDRTTKTVALLDEYADAKEEFLILHFQVCLINHSGYASLIVTPSYREAPVKNIDSPTMTELKQSSTNLFTKFDRLKPLYDEVQKLGEKFKQLDQGQIIPFEQLYPIGGQNSSNRIGYGNEYCGDLLVYEGTLYGEVSDYIAVGFIYEPYSELFKRHRYL